MSPQMVIALCAWVSLSCAIVVRRKRSLHILFAHVGIGLDIALVVHLQLERQAVQTALSFTLSALEQLHIATSTLAVILYFPVLALGHMLRRRPSAAKVRVWHCGLALAAFTFRTVGLMFMFMVA